MFNFPLRPKNIFCFMTIFLLAMSNLMVHAQSVEGTLDKTAVEVKNNELLNLMLKIKNNSGETFSVVTELKTSLNLLTKNESQNILNAGDSAFMPLKVLIPANAKAGHKYQLTVTLKTKDNRIFDRDTCAIVIQKNRLVRLFVSGNDVLLRKDSDAFSIPLRLVNAGNTKESVSILASFPAAFNNYLEKIVKTELRPFTDTTIYYTRKNTKSLYRHGDFQINISGLYKDGNVFGMGTINVQTAKSTLSYTRQQNQARITMRFPAILRFPAAIYTALLNITSFRPAIKCCLPGENQASNLTLTLPHGREAVPGCY